MTLNITVASTEIEDFALDIAIDSNATFLDLHRTILEACDYEEGDYHRFYICDENWRPEHRILLTDEGTSSDEDLLLMEETPLIDYLEDEGQRLAYRFDPESKRLFLMELSETSFGKRLEKPKVKRRHGMPPTQTLAAEETVNKPATHQQNAVEEELGEEFYGDDGYEEGEIDFEGFDITE